MNGKQHLHEIYTLADPSYTGRVTVPVLWDRQTGTIVSNESSEIIRMFNAAFDTLTGNTSDFYPEKLHAAIDPLNERIYATVNNGVYRAGFASSQDAYNEAVQELFETLDMLEERLAQQRYLTGSSLTEADLRLFPTLVRFDAVYVGRFKCKIRRIADYEHLSAYLRDIYQTGRIADTVDFHHIKFHYYASHRHINPTGIVPVGPQMDLDAL